MIPVAALALLKQPKALMIGLAVVAVAIVVLVLKLQIAGLERDVARLQGDLDIARANLATAERVNAGNVAELAKINAAAAAARTAFANESKRAQARCDVATKTQEAVRRAQIESPATCPVAPALRAAVDGLRELVAGSADRDPDRAGDDQATR